MIVHNPNGLPTKPIADLLPTQGDLKDLTEVNYNKLKNVIERRGFSYPVYVWEDKDKVLHLLDGHQRQRVLNREGWNEPIPYLKVPARDLKEAMARLLEITSQYATITQEGIDEFIGRYELNEAEVYEATSFDALGSYGSEEEPEVEEDEAPEVSSEPPVSKLGEIYQLGKHFVMCGDSTDNADISKLLSGAEIELLLTDPPYNLGFSYNQYDDNKTLEEYEKLLSKAIYDIDVPKKIVTPGKQNLFSAYKLSRVTDVAIWYSKNKMSGGKISNLSLWEPLVFIGDFDRNTRATDVLEYTNENQKDTGDHTCPKTVKLFTELLKYSSTNSNVLDTFIGSGTTLIACEQTDRTCYGMELDPKYVDVIRKRYAKFIQPDNELPDNWEELTPAIRGKES